MFYNFPTITHIDDVLPAIEGCSDFIVAQRDGYKIINYMVAKEDTFDGPHAAIRRECRGLKFDLDGKLIARPYHKFFNLGEKAEARNPNLSIPHVILEKLDGSFIHPFLVNGKLELSTKMGITDVAKQVYPFLDANPNYKEFMEDMIFRGCTPIFEWCSRQQRIVVDYPVDRLVLTAIRENSTGNYHSLSSLNKIAEKYDIEVVKSYDAMTYEQALKVIEFEGGEGIVIRFDNGHMLKVKTETYLQLHRVKASIEQERNVIALILDEKLDDLRPLLSDTDLARLNKFEHSVVFGMQMAAMSVSTKLKEGQYLSRKDFALQIAPRLHENVRMIAFKLFGTDPAIEVIFDAIKDRLRDCLTSTRKLDENRYLINAAQWKEVKLDA